MVMHSHMLNPRNFLEDCLRVGHRGLWLAGLPWKLVDDAININSFDYDVSDEAKAQWVAQTGRDWDNTSDSMVKKMKCPYAACRTTLEIPWTTCGVAETSKCSG
jgi:hypothetical protein